ncbi:MAG TPA: hypothetical protein VFX41_10350 [Actinomycetales bacterium]|nr:hypothetical protein [Actinomycetales bacterium]
MRTIVVTALYWSAVAFGSLLAVVSGFDLAVADHDPLPAASLAGLLPRTVYLLITAVLALVLAGTAAAMAAAGRQPADRAPASRALLGIGALAAVVLILLSLSTGLLAFVGYLPLALVLTPFNETMREAFLAAVDHSVLTQLAIVVGVLLWGAAARRHLRIAAVSVPAWARPHAAARWGRAAVAVAVVPPLAYAATRFAWLVYPLGFDRPEWEAARASGDLLPGVWLGAFAVVGAVLTLGLAQRWGEVFPRWLPGLAGRRVPVALAVVPASFVSATVLPAGISMIRQVVTQAAEIEVIDGWASFGPTFLWPLWGVALAVATLGYALRRSGDRGGNINPRAKVE